jgi:hypothetical protein
VQCSSPFKAIDARLANLDDRAGKIDNTLVAVGKDLDLLRGWARKHDQQFPGGHQQTAPEEQKTDITEPEETPRANGTQRFPSNIKPVMPPECVHSRFHRKFPCEDASMCYPRSGYTQEQWGLVQKKSGAGDMMQICDEKERAPKVAPAK